MEPPAPPKDPMKSFRGVLAGTLIMEAIVVALALPVVANLRGGVGSWTGVSIIVIAVALLGCCLLLATTWSNPVVVLLQLALIAFFAVVPAVAVIGVLFLAIWCWLLWLRRNVARRMAAGTLPSQQQSE